MLLLVIWGVKAVHYALQPKYQGKTMEEWFAEAPIPPFAFMNGQLHSSTEETPSVAAMRYFGTNAVTYLWQEYHREDGDLKLWLNQLWTEHIDEEAPAGLKLARDQRYVAEGLLLAVRSNAQSLIPRLVAQLDEPSTQVSNEAADWIARFAIQPELCVPALIRTLENPHLASQTRRTCYIEALACFGEKAESALPVLIKIHDDPATTAPEKRDAAVAIVRIDRGWKNPELVMRVLDANDSELTKWAIGRSPVVEQLSPALLPYLERFAENASGPLHKGIVRGVIKAIKSRPVKP